jgi:hypothetical protein
MTRQARSWMQALLALASIAPAPALAERIDAAGFANAVALVERDRGLEFRHVPAYERVATTDDPDYRALAESPRRLRVECPGAGFTMVEQTGAVADFAGDRVVALRDADAQAVRVALGQLLDAQHYPDLIHDAATLPGDEGMARRGLLAASSCAAAQGGLGPVPAEPAADPFADPTLEVPEPVGDLSIFRTANLAASGLLRRQADREAPFRRPPHSTAELFVPGLWERGRKALPIDGAIPEPAGCKRDRDESVGVFVLVRALAARGGSVPRGAVAGWRGDRLVTFACEDGREPWIYTATLESAGDADDFRAAVDRLLPSDLPRPIEVAGDGTRVSVWHELPEMEARGFGAPPESAER